jgi:hypothetical protein
MREDLFMRYIIMCRSQTYAQRASRTLERAGITAPFSRAPQGLSKSGCAWCVRVVESRYKQALDVLKRAGVSYGKVFTEEDGKYAEVS